MMEPLGTDYCKQTCSTVAHELENIETHQSCSARTQVRTTKWGKCERKKEETRVRKRLKWHQSGRRTYCLPC